MRSMWHSIIQIRHLETSVLSLSRARRSREPQARAERGDPGFWLRSRRSESSHIWLRSKKGKGQPENVL